MNYRKAAILATAGAFLVLPAFAAADMTWDFNTVVSGDTPGGSAPYATLECVDLGDGAAFTLTFNDSVGDEGEFLGQLDLAYNGDLSGASFSSVDSSQVTGGTFGSFTDAGGSYDVKIDFNNANNGFRIEPGDVVHFQITGTGIECENFTDALLHIQGTGLNNEGSSKVGPGAVPEPASMAALGMGALGLLARRRRAKK